MRDKTKSARENGIKKTTATLNDTFVFNAS